MVVLSLSDCVVDILVTQIKIIDEQGWISPSLLGHLLLIAVAVVSLAMLQNRYWNGEFGYHELAKLKKDIQKQERLNAEQRSVNAVLRADVTDLKSGLTAIEEHARTDLGFIKSGETFVQISTAPVSYASAEVTGVDNVAAIEPIDEIVPSSEP